MRKILKGLCSVFCVALLLGGASSCQSISAYDIAVKNGYQGTEEQWLESLRGQDGEDGKDGQDLTASDLYETAKANGYEGSYLDFCKDILKIDTPKEDHVDSIASNITSVVSIYCAFSKTECQLIQVLTL